MLNSSSRITFIYVSKSELSTQHGWRKLWKMCHRFLWWCHKRDTQWLPAMSLPSDTSSQPVSMPPSLSLSHNSFFLTFDLFLFLPYSPFSLSLFLPILSLSSLSPNSLFLSLSIHYDTYFLFTGSVLHVSWVEVDKSDVLPALQVTQVPDVRGKVYKIPKY